MTRTIYRVVQTAALELQGALAESLRVLRMAVEATSPADAEALAWHHVQLAKLCARMGDTSAAAREIRLALSVVPGYPDAVSISNLAAF